MAMAALPVQGNRKRIQGPRSPREAVSPPPESSLSWCLSHLYKPAPTAEAAGNSGTTAASDAGSRVREVDKRSRAAQWRALVAIRTQHIKGGQAGIAKFRIRGGLQPLLSLLKDPECSRKALDLALSILANCCTEVETRVEVRKLGGIAVVVDILKRNVAVETVQNRAARALGNLAMDPENSTLIHSAGAVPLLLLCVSLVSTSSPSPAPPCPKMECAHSAARALLYLSDTPGNRLSLLTQGAVSALAPLVAPELPAGLRRAALRALHDLTRSCGAECARELSRSGVLARLGAVATGEPGSTTTTPTPSEEELALKTLANVCSQSCLRPLVGSLGVIPRFVREVGRDPLRAAVFLRALCLCCKEAVNRAKVKECGGLEALVSFLAAHRRHPLSRLAVLACVDFVYDEAAVEQLQELGLVPLLVARLVQLTEETEPAPEASLAPGCGAVPTELMLPSASFESFDFPPLDENKREEGGREPGLGSPSFLSLRSWLVSEGLITSEGDLESPSSAEGEWVQVSPSSSSSSSSSPPTSSSIPQEHLPCATSLSTSSSERAPLPRLDFSSPSPQRPSPTSTPQPPPCSSSTPKPSSCSSSSPQLQLVSPHPPPSPSSFSSPARTPLQQAPSKFSSPQRKRPRVHLPARLARVSVDSASASPPSAPRLPSSAASSPAYHHPFHPEPWAPESPLLLLLSRFSHTPDPSAALVTTATICGLLVYLTRHRCPSSRCFRMLCRLSCDPNCLQALLRTGAVALVHRYLCQTDGPPERGEQQSSCVKAKVKQLGLALLNNLRVQCESGFGSGVLAHVMLTGTESDKINCALSLPLIHSNKALLKKLLLDSGGLLLALEPLDCSEEDGDEGHSAKCVAVHSDWLTSPHLVPASQLHSLYFSLLIGCLSSLTVGVNATNVSRSGPSEAQSAGGNSGGSPPPVKKLRLANCPYGDSTFDLLFLLDNGNQLSASREAVAGSEVAGRAGSEYFRALLGGGFREAQGGADAAAIPIGDVSVGMLLPVLHYLHGCRRDDHAGARRQCEVLGSLADEVFGGRTDPGERSAEETGFRNTPLGETMVGACRFLVDGLKREAEELCISLLLACSVGQVCVTAPMENISGRNHDDCTDDGESADESLAKRTSGLELSGAATGKPPLLEESRRKNSTPTSSAKFLKPAEKREEGSEVSSSSSSSSPSSSAETASTVWTLSGLLPELYWFSQRYSYPKLGRVCLSLLLTPPQPCLLNNSSVGDCLRRLVRQADCTDTLKRDILTVVTLALS